MKYLPAAIEEHVRSLPEGTVITAKSLMHLGKRAAVDQALSRLARSGRLIRVGRGAYVATVAGKYGTRPPEPARVVESLGQATGEIVVPHPAASANRLGLSLQVPVRSVYLTSGRSRRLKLGKLEVELRHAPIRELRLGHGAVPEAIRALAWLGPRHGAEQLPRLLARLESSQRQELLRARPAMPGWLAAEVSKVVGRA
ncbi:MAG TPA: DUF6088 family protein [Pseudomonas sp.]|jgi:hypothetical protein|nr:DUF6088 family protein [Pseudomonas sp.]